MSWARYSLEVFCRFCCSGIMFCFYSRANLLLIDILLSTPKATFLNRKFTAGEQSVQQSYRIKDIGICDQHADMNNSGTDDAFENVLSCSRAVSTMLISAISFVSIAAFVGNSLVAIIFLMNTTLGTSTNYFIVNMAISDLVSSLTNWPLSTTEGFFLTKHTIGGSMATFLCKLGHYSRAISQAVSVQSLLLIIVDRYVAVVLPLKSIFITGRFRAVLLSFTWMFPLLVGFPYVWTSKIIEKGHQTGCRTFVSWSKAEQSIFYTVGFLIFYCAPLISIIVFYSRIMKSLRKPTTGGEEQENIRIRKLHQNRIVMKVFIWIVSAFFICWTPLCLYIVLKKIFPTSHFAKDPCMLYAALFFYVFPTLSTVINPIILFVSSTRFSEALKETLGCFRCKRSQCFKGEHVSPENDMVRMQEIGY